MKETFWLPAFTLCRRELVRFFRQPNRVIGAIGSPLVFWVLIGAGVGPTFQMGEAGSDLSYLAYFLPGVVALVVLFTAIFSTISIIEDRKEGFLQAVLVAPIDRSALVLGKFLGGTLIAVVQGLVFLVLAPTAGLHLTAGSVLFTVLALFLVAFGLTGLGFLMAWRMTSVQGFHAIMNLFLFPMWLLSGAVFPITEKTPAWIAWIMRLNPLTYSVELIRRGFHPGGGFGAKSPSLALSLGLSIAFCLVTFTISSIMAASPGGEIG